MSSGTNPTSISIAAVGVVFIYVKGHSRSVKIVPCESVGTVSYSSSIATMAAPLAISKIFGVKQ